MALRRSNGSADAVDLLGNHNAPGRAALKCARFSRSFAARSSTCLLGAGLMERPESRLLRDMAPLISSTFVRAKTVSVQVSDGVVGTNIVGVPQT